MRHVSTEMSCVGSWVKEELAKDVGSKLSSLHTVENPRTLPRLCPRKTFFWICKF